MSQERPKLKLVTIDDSIQKAMVILRLKTVFGHTVADYKRIKNSVLLLDFFRGVLFIVPYDEFRTRFLEDK